MEKLKRYFFHKDGMRLDVSQKDCNNKGDWIKYEDLKNMPLEELLKEYECKEDCVHMKSKWCILGSGGNCIRQAEDYYQKSFNSNR